MKTADSYYTENTTVKIKEFFGFKALFYKYEGKYINFARKKWQKVIASNKKSVCLGIFHTIIARSKRIYV